jgi:hypothetical protein
MQFPRLIPTRPYCADCLSDGLQIKSKGRALSHRHIQLNWYGDLRWLAFDVDRRGAYLAADDAYLPPPNVTAVNPENRHAHLLYLLESSIPKFDCERRRPYEFAAAVQRGITRRLGADPGYVNLISKNPLHWSWDVTWHRSEPYTLGELDGWLWRSDKWKDCKAESTGEGRNVDTFNELREIAYKLVTTYKRNGGSRQEYERRLYDIASDLNVANTPPMSRGEVRQIAKSRWTWRTFSIERFSAIQARRASTFRRRNLEIIANLGNVGDMPKAQLAVLLDRSVRTARRYVATRVRNMRSAQSAEPSLGKPKGSAGVPGIAE